MSIRNETDSIISFFSVLITSIVMIGTTWAGLDQHDRFGGQVIAFYQFENIRDGGPNRFNGRLIRQASIVDNGKYRKCLKVERDAVFSYFNKDRTYAISIEIAGF